MPDGQVPEPSGWNRISLPVDDLASTDGVGQIIAEAVLDGWNQYPPTLGLPELRTAIAALLARHRPALVLAPHALDDNPSHRGVYRLSEEATFAFEHPVWQDTDDYQYARLHGCIRPVTKPIGSH